KVSIDEFTYVALMTHNYNYDKKLLSILIENENLHYIGVLGPRKKITRMLDEFVGEGILLSESQMAKIYSPIGINIGAETSSEIALSIIAEIQAVSAGKLVYSLRDALHGIHAKTEMIGG
ncbi:MAG TPA: XdhC family protein, partial [Saprospiraceae bacterium]|nr:XdhC family protein [Saprospiraceae bacterium]